MKEAGETVVLILSLILTLSLYRYLISGDSFGDVLAWRLDNNGWYQLLRKFKKDVAVPSGKTNASGVANPSKYSSHLYEHQTSFNYGSILSLSMHPDRNKGLMLVLSRQPSQLKVINMTSYRTLSFCEGFNGVFSSLVHENNEDYSMGIFYRSTFSADGRYIVCCVAANNNASAGIQGRGQRSVGKGTYQLLVWDTFTGHLVNTPLSSMRFLCDRSSTHLDFSSFLVDITFPHPVRSIAWHPTQHVLAVSMVSKYILVFFCC
jgi:hypothetical protein